MKKFYMTMAAMLCGVAAMAQTYASISVEPLAFTADDVTVTPMNIIFNTDNAAGFTSAGVVFELPAGITVNQIWDEDDEEYKADVVSPMAKSSHTVMLNPSSTNPQRFTLAVAHKTSTLKTSTNILATIGLKASKDMTPGNYQIVFGECSNGFGTETKFRYTPDPVAITVAFGTGINSINAADSKAPIYNLAGQRVSKAQQGVFIQNGKKIANK